MHAPGISVISLQVSASLGSVHVGSMWSPFSSDGGGGVLVLQNGSGYVSDDLYPCGRSEGSCDPTALSLLSLLFGTGERLGDESLPPTDKVRL